MGMQDEDGMGTGSRADGCDAGTHGRRNRLTRSIIDRFYDVGEAIHCMSPMEIATAQLALKRVRSVSSLSMLAASVPEVGMLMDVPSARWMMEDTVQSTRDGTRQAFQCGALTECVLTDFLSKVLCTNWDVGVAWADSADATQAMWQAVEAVHDRMPKARPRYFAQVGNGTTVVQLGGPKAADCAIVRDGTIVTVEIKDKWAKAGEFDLLETEDGKLLADAKARRLIEEQMPSIMQVVADFNAHDTTLAHVGHNVKLSEATQRHIFHDYLRRGDIDLVLTFSDDNVPVIMDAHASSIDECFRMDNGEIRTAGRNSKHVYTPERLASVLRSSASFVDAGNGMFSIRYDDAEHEGRLIRKRGGMEVTRIRISNVFFVRLRDVTVSDGIMSFCTSDVRQLKPTVSAHISCPLPYEDVRAIETGRVPS